MCCYFGTFVRFVRIKLPFKAKKAILRAFEKAFYVTMNRMVFKSERNAPTFFISRGAS